MTTQRPTPVHRGAVRLPAGNVIPDAEVWHHGTAFIVFWQGIPIVTMTDCTYTPTMGPGRQHCYTITAGDGRRVVTMPGRRRRRQGPPAVLS